MLFLASFMPRWFVMRMMSRAARRFWNSDDLPAEEGIRREETCQILEEIADHRWPGWKQTDGHRSPFIDAGEYIDKLFGGSEA